MSKQLDPRVKDKMGYFEDKSGKYFKHLSFDAESGTYWIQQGRINQGGRVKMHAPKSLTYPGHVENHVTSYTKEGYTQQTLPENVKNALRSFDELNKKIPNQPEPATEAAAPIIPTLEIVEGNTVKIGRQVVSVNEPDEVTLAAIPEINPHYAFPELVNDIIQDLLESRKIMLTGHTGCGKTSVIEQVAARLKFGTVRSNMNGQTTVHDFVGMWTVKGGETVWVDGVLPRAMKDGLWLIIDEIDCADASILAVLNAVLEKKGCLTLKEKGCEIVKPHKNFRLIATANTAGCMAAFRPLYQGTNILNEAFLDRFRVYQADYLPASEETKMIMLCVPKLPKDVGHKMVEIANTVRKMFFEEKMACTFSTRRLLDWAEMYTRHNSYAKSAQNVLYSKMGREDAETLKGLIQRLDIR